MCYIALPQSMIFKIVNIIFIGHASILMYILVLTPDKKEILRTSKNNKDVSKQLIQLN